jgi:imidazolonepropionase
MWDSLWVDVTAATMAPVGEPDNDQYGLIADAAVAVSGERIAWVGPRSDLQGPPERLARTVHSGGGRCVTPGFIDCHTHLVFGGERSREFELRAAGADYATITANGGGIRSTVERTRSLSAEELVDVAMPRARSLLSEGVTTIEIKSGYGLEVDAEIRLLRAVRLLAERIDADVVPTLLAAHALPAAYASDRQGYIDRICAELIPTVARENLASAVDVFCESIAFTVEECAQVLACARAHGLAVKVHADQLSDMGAAALAAEYGALSADHIEYTSKSGVAALAASGAVAVLLPGAYLMLGETQRPPVDECRKLGVPMALSTDCNPGTSPSTSLALMLPLGCALFGLTPAEALAGVTRNAARALGLLHSHGTLEQNKQADFVLWDVDHPRELAYWLGGNR